MPGNGKLPIAIEELGLLAEELRKRARVLTVIEKAGTAKGITTPAVLGKPMVNRALASIDSFIRSCKREVEEL